MQTKRIIHLWKYWCDEWGEEGEALSHSCTQPHTLACTKTCLLASPREGGQTRFQVIVNPVLEQNMSSVHLERTLRKDKIKQEILSVEKGGFSILSFLDLILWGCWFRARLHWQDRLKQFIFATTWFTFPFMVVLSLSDRTKTLGCLSDSVRASPQSNEIQYTSTALDTLPCTLDTAYLAIPSSAFLCCLPVCLYRGGLALIYQCSDKMI